MLSATDKTVFLAYNPSAHREAKFTQRPTLLPSHGFGGYFRVNETPRQHFGSQAPPDEQPPGKEDTPSLSADET